MIDPTNHAPYTLITVSDSTVTRKDAMTDIVDRLRAAAPGTMLSMQVNDLAALREAADEIERLRARVLELERGAYVSGLRLNQQSTSEKSSG